MSTELSIHFEVEAVAPETLQTLKSYTGTLLGDLMQSSDLQETILSGPDVTFDQFLPMTKEQLEVLTIGLAFIFKEGPNIVQQVKTIIEYLTTRLTNKGPTTTSLVLRMGSKKVEATGLSPEDILKFITEQQELEVRPRRKRS